MNINDSNQTALAISDIYAICAFLPEKVHFSLDITPKYNQLQVTIMDSRDKFECHRFTYHEQMSVSLNAQGFREWLATVL